MERVRLALSCLNRENSSIVDVPFAHPDSTEQFKEFMIYIKRNGFFHSS